MKAMHDMEKTVIGNMLGILYSCTIKYVRWIQNAHTNITSFSLSLTHKHTQPFQISVCLSQPVSFTTQLSTPTQIKSYRTCEWCRWEVCEGELNYHNCVIYTNIPSRSYSLSHSNLVYSLLHLLCSLMFTCSWQLLALLVGWARCPGGVRRKHHFHLAVIYLWDENITSWDIELSCSI